VTVLAAYMFSRFSVYAVLFPNLDATGRYLAPLATFVPLALAGAAVQASRAGRLPRLLAAAGVSLLFVGTAVPYLTSKPDAPFQSPYFRQLPPSNAALIAALDELSVDAVWMDHWAGTPLMFDTQERILAADYMDLRVAGGIDRFAADTRRVFSDERPAYVFVTDARHTPLEDALTQQNVPFEARSVGGYRIVLPSNYVDPATVLDALRDNR
jgi:hypothetical protein